LVEELCLDNEKDWKEFNEKTYDGSFFHTLKWKSILERSFGYKSHYFLVYYKDRVIATCPFYESSLKGFKGLMPLPNSDYHHILVDKQNFNHLVAKTITNKCHDISKKNRLSFILINTLSKEIKDNFNEPNLFPFPWYIIGTMILDLKENHPEKIWNNIFSQKGKQRKYIRRFIKDGFKIKEVKSLKDLKIFYKYYKTNLEYINAVPYSFSHFEEIWNTYSSTNMITTLLYKNEKVFGGQLHFLYPSRKTIYLKYLALNRDIPRKYTPTYYIFWDAIVRASQMGYTTICYGSTNPNPDEIHYQIKKKFGCYYEESYSIVFPLSVTFKVAYHTYQFANKHLPHYLRWLGL